MNYLIDDVARTLAGSTPRRSMLKLIGGALAGGLFGSLAFGQSGFPQDPKCTGATGSPCGNNGQKKCCGQVCIGAGNSDNCCSNASYCPPTQCCSFGGVTGCCPPGTNFVPSASCNTCAYPSKTSCCIAGG